MRILFTGLWTLQFRLCHEFLSDLHFHRSCFHLYPSYWPVLHSRNSTGVRHWNEMWTHLREFLPKDVSHSKSVIVFGNRLDLPGFLQDFSPIFDMEVKTFSEAEFCNVFCFLSHCNVLQEIIQKHPICGYSLLLSSLQSLQSLHSLQSLQVNLAHLRVDFRAFFLLQIKHWTKQLILASWWLLRKTLEIFSCCARSSWRKVWISQTKNCLNSPRHNY